MSSKDSDGSVRDQQGLAPCDAAAVPHSELPSLLTTRLIVLRSFLSRDELCPKSLCRLSAHLPMFVTPLGTHGLFYIRQLICTAQEVQLSLEDEKTVVLPLACCATLAGHLAFLVLSFLTYRVSVPG